MFLLDTVLGDERYMQEIQGWSLTEEQGRALMNFVMVLAALVAIYVIFRFIEKIVSRFLPEKREIVIVERTHWNQLYTGDRGRKEKNKTILRRE